MQENGNHDLTENLKQQLNTLNAEKECITKLWQEAVKAVYALEDELKIFQAGHENLVPKRELQKVRKVSVSQPKSLKLERFQ